MRTATIAGTVVVVGGQRRHPSRPQGRGARTRRHPRSRTSGVIGLLSARLTGCWAERRSTWSGDRKLQRGPIFQITRFTALVAGSGINRMPEGYQERSHRRTGRLSPRFPGPDYVICRDRLPCCRTSGRRRYRGRPSRIRVLSGLKRQQRCVSVIRRRRSGALPEHSCFSEGSAAEADRRRTGATDRICGRRCPRLH